MMKEEHTAEMTKLINSIKTSYRKINSGIAVGDYEKVFKYLEQEEELIKRFQGDVPEEIKILHTRCLWYRTTAYAFMGDLARSFKVANELLMVAQLYEQRWGISVGIFALGKYYWVSGDLDKAFEHIDRAIRLIEETLNDFWDFILFADQLYYATRILIDKEDLERAKKYFKRLEEIMALKSGVIFINVSYRLAKAFLLKSSMRFRDRVIAEDLFRKIIEETHPHFMYKLGAFSGLCELLLVELRFSNDINIINDIKPLLEKLIGMAQQSGLNYWLIEAYILHGKLALVMFDIESSQRFLTQARRMAERFGFVGLADEIASLHDAMMEKMDTWKQLEKTNAPLSERMELARLDDHLKGKFRTRMMKMERITEKEVTVYKESKTCLVCKGSAGGFNIYVCPTCDSIYCKGCAQAVIDLENQCWMCNSPIDASKPIKPYKPEIEVEVGDIKESKRPKKY